MKKIYRKGISQTGNYNLDNDASDSLVITEWDRGIDMQFDFRVPGGKSKILLRLADNDVSELKNMCEAYIARNSHKPLNEYTVQELLEEIGKRQ